MSDLAPGTELGGRFSVLGVLGAGGMATVYLCEDRLRGGRVALKVLHAHLGSDPAMRARLRREVEASVRLRHPGALVAHELHELDGRLALSMPYHPGRTLAELVATSGALPPAQVRTIGLRLADVLAEAHRRGLLHRDISPSNVMIDERGEAMLMDFGLARLDDGQSARSTGVLGTAGYVAPEVYAGTRADPRSDLYGLGGVLYLAATGQPPFGSGPPATVMQRQLDGTVRPPVELRPGLPQDLSDTLLALLRADPLERPPGAEALHEALTIRAAPSPAAPAPASTESAASTAAQAENPALPARRLPAGMWAVDVQERNRDRRRRAGLRRVAGGFPTEPGALSEAVRQRVELGVRQWLQVGRPVSPEEMLLAAVATEAGVPPERLPSSRTLLERRFRLVEGVDGAVAQRLASVANSAGFRATVVPVASQLPAAITRLPPGIVPVAWVGFGLLSATGVGLIFAPFALLICIALTILVGLAQREARRAVAFPQQTPPVVPPIAEKTPVAPAKPLTRGQGLAARANAELDALASALSTADLPTLAQEELRRTLTEARAECATLAADVDRIEAEIAGSRPPDEAGWADARLTRLRTLQRAGETVDPAEIRTLEAALAAREADARAAAGLEAGLVTRLARLLEISASASRSRRELVGGAHPTPKSADEVLGRLQAQARAAAAARKELG